MTNETFRTPELHRKRDGWLFIDDDGRVLFLGPLWYRGAQIAYAAATVKAWICYRLFMLLGLGRINGLRWRLLPSAGDWAYRDDYGRLSSLAVFIHCDLKRRARHHQEQANV